MMIFPTPGGSESPFVLIRDMNNYYIVGIKFLKRILMQEKRSHRTANVKISNDTNNFSLVSQPFCTKID